MSARRSRPCRTDGAPLARSRYTAALERGRSDARTFQQARPSGLTTAAWRFRARPYPRPIAASASFRETGRRGWTERVMVPLQRKYSEAIELAEQADIDSPPEEHEGRLYFVGT